MVKIPGETGDIFVKLHAALTGIIVSLLLIVVYPCIIISCYNNFSEYILCDFEAIEDLDRLGWECHSLLSLSHEHATHGAASLKTEIFPTGSFRLMPWFDRHDWSIYKSLCFDVYNPSGEDMHIYVRIEDRKIVHEYNDAYYDKVSLRPGLNHIDIPLKILHTKNSSRKISLEHIYRFYITMFPPAKKTVLYFDYLRLLP